MEIGKVSGVSFENNVVSGVDSSDFFASSGYIIVPAMEFRFDTTLGDGLPELTIRIATTFDTPVWSTIIDWGDGTQEEYFNTTFSHTYSTGGVYDVKVYKFGVILTGSTGSGFASKDKIIDIKQFSRTIVLRSLSYCSELTSISSITTPVLYPFSLQLFRSDQKLSTVNNINSWDLSGVTDLIGTFSLCSVFNEDISGWNVSNVHDMRRMFQSATSFNQDISGWNVSNVDDMSLMFSSASSFDQNLGAWTFKNNCNLSNIFPFSGMSDANVALCLEGWDSVGQGTGVDATDMFGLTARTISESTYPDAKAAYDDLIANNSWDFTGSFNWVA